jgi:hypothetical protein
MWAMGSTAAPRCTGSTLHAFSGWPLAEGTVGAQYHGVADEGVPFREIAEVIGRHLNVPVVARPASHFGLRGNFGSIDSPTSSRLTQERTP